MYPQNEPHIYNAGCDHAFAFHSHHAGTAASCANSSGATGVATGRAAGEGASSLRASQTMGLRGCPRVRKEPSNKTRKGSKHKATVAGLPLVQRIAQVSLKGPSRAERCLFGPLVYSLALLQMRLGICEASISLTFTPAVFTFQPSWLTHPRTAFNHHRQVTSLVTPSERSNMRSTRRTRMTVASR